MSFGMMYGNQYHDSKGGVHKNSINGERFVYYQRLLTDSENTDISASEEIRKNWKELWEHSSRLFGYRLKEGADFHKIANYFKGLRDGEYAKELALLREKFGPTFMQHYKYADDPGSKETVGIHEKLIGGINELLNLKEVFLRNLALIRDTKGQYQMITFFNEYFDRVYEDSVDDIMKSIENADPQKSFEENVTEAMNYWMPEIVRRTLVYVFDKVGQEKGLGKEHQAAYKELLQFLEPGNSLGQEVVKDFMKDYGLDKIISEMGRWDKDWIKNFNTKETLDNFKKQSSKGGLASESLGNFIANAATQVLENVKGTKTGGTLQKADFIITFNLSTNFISDWIEENSFGTRDLDVSATNKITQALNKIDRGFVVYVNAKNQGISKGQYAYKMGGFSAGTPITLDTWDSMMHAAFKKGRDLIFMALQLIPGAIGEGQKEKVSAAFARAISSALFDDFTTIGEVTEKGEAIHLLYLNGIYIPLSFYYNLLYKAFDSASKERMDKLIQVTIDIPSQIEFPEMEDQEEWQDSHPDQSPWNFQSHEALNNIEIGFRFFQSFKEEMEKLNINLI